MERDRDFLQDILESARIALSHVKNMKLEDFLNDIQCQDAVIRRLEIIGEASRRISEETRKIYPELPWSEMVNMRNIMIHEYDEVDLNIVWDTTLNDLPPLIIQIEKILRQ
jgi:uncharacterized protein with HEPN domain